MRPLRRAFIVGRKAWVTRKVAVRFAASMSFHMSSPRSRKEARATPPALLTTMSTGPKPASTWSRKRSTSAFSRTSQAVCKQRWRSPGDRSSRKLPLRLPRAHPATAAPALAKPVAMARPMPADAPVTTATLPSRMPGDPVTRRPTSGRARTRAGAPSGRGVRPSRPGRRW